MRIAIFLLMVAADWLSCAFTRAGEPNGLVFSGETHWDPATGTLTFGSSGSMPETREEFHWTVPSGVKRIVIGGNVVVRGAFRVAGRVADNPLLITGENRDTSVLFGTEEERWTTRNGIADSDKWKYGAIGVLADAEVYVSDLTSRNPRGYHFSGYAEKAVLHASRCKLLDTRPGQNNNSDGFVGAAGSSLSDTFISTGDDAVKVYRDITIRDVTIEQHRNGAPIQFGWGGETGRVKANIENLTIRGVDPDHRYNMAPFTWEGGTTGTRDVQVRGLKVDLPGQVYDESTATWRPMGLVELKPKGCTLDLRIERAEIKGLGPGIRLTPGVLVVDGVPW